MRSLGPVESNPTNTMSKISKPLGFTLTDKQLDALEAELRAAAGEDGAFNPAYTNAAHMIHNARMAANKARFEKLKQKLIKRHQLGI